jgi:hypothetical protein
MFFVGLVSHVLGRPAGCGYWRGIKRFNIRTFKEFLNLLRKLFEGIGWRFIAHFERIVSL